MESKQYPYFAGKSGEDPCGCKNGVCLLRNGFETCVCKQGFRGEMTVRFFVFFLGKDLF